jgi:hypothetical protein
MLSLSATRYIHMYFVQSQLNGVFPRADIAHACFPWVPCQVPCCALMRGHYSKPNNMSIRNLIFLKWLLTMCGSRDRKLFRTKITNHNGPFAVSEEISRPFSCRLTVSLPRFPVSFFPFELAELAPPNVDSLTGGPSSPSYHDRTLSNRVSSKSPTPSQLRRPQTPRLPTPTRPHMTT